MDLYDVTQYGARPGDETINTEAIQKAIDECGARGGGCVHVPAGTFRTGRLRLRSGVRLHLEAGARLQAVVDPKAYDETPDERSDGSYVNGLVTGYGLHDVAIDGDGAIDGRGPEWWREDPHQENKLYFGWVPTFYYSHPEHEGRRFVVNLVKFVNCSNVRVRDVSLVESEHWTLVLLNCEGVYVRGVRLMSPLHGPNTDGIDVEGCEDVRISDCEFYTADDAVCIANYNAESHGRPCRHITVTNCLIVTACNALKIYGARGLYEDITMSNCVIRPGRPEEALSRLAAKTIDPAHHGNALAALSGICIESGSGGTVRNVAVSNIVMEDARAPFFIRLSNHGRARETADRPSEPGVMEDIVINNVVARGGSTTSTITGIPGHRIRGLSISDVRIEVTGGGGAELADAEPPEKEDWYPDCPMFGRLPAHGFYCRHVEDLTFRNVAVRAREPDARPMLVADDVRGIVLDDVRMDAPATGLEPIRFTDVAGAVVRVLNPPVADRDLIRLYGNSSDIRREPAP